MTESELLHQLKSGVSQFPNFLRDFLKNPLRFVDFEPRYDWVHILLYGYITNAAANTITNIATGNLTSLLPGLIFNPIQSLFSVSIISFIVWVAVDKAGFATLKYQSVFKLLLFSELIVSVFIIPVFLTLYYMKSVEFMFLLSAIKVLANCYFFYRGFTKQFGIIVKRALGITSIYGILFLMPIVSDYFDDYGMRHQARENIKINEEQMEESIRAIEKDFSD